MIRAILSSALGLCLVAVTLFAAQDAGSASGQGTIDRLSWVKDAKEPTVEKVAFAPRYSYAYREGTGSTAMTWLVLTEQPPPLEAWARAKDRAEARRLWSEKEKASFIAVQLNAQGGVELIFLCPGNGNVNTEMVSTINGLASVVVTITARDDGRLKGTLSCGEGACDDPPVYCTKKGDYVFDAPLLPGG
ncbi:MAG TPA: hypothetical protein VNN08_07595 [Thermoanaerobaculia bacterium]|nr:hypothetical protein [Thermoanaerobaculia bacterium]